MKETLRPFALCLQNVGHTASLEARKLYQMLPTQEKERGFLRIIDETGEDYLYPSHLFLVLELPVEVEKSFAYTI